MTSSEPRPAAGRWEDFLTVMVRDQAVPQSVKAKLVELAEAARRFGAIEAAAGPPASAERVTRESLAAAFDEVWSKFREPKNLDSRQWADAILASLPEAAVQEPPLLGVGLGGRAAQPAPDSLDEELLAQALEVVVPLDHPMAFLVQREQAGKIAAEYTRLLHVPSPRSQEEASEGRSE